MINRHIGYYLGSKLVAAVLALAAMALFVRVGGAETYGAYVVMLAWAYVIYGISVQWMRFSFFACYRDETGADLIATWLRALLAAFALLVLIVSASYWAGFLAADFALGLIVLNVGLVTYEALHEIARTRLKAETVAVGVLSRSALMLLFGLIAVWTYATPLSLAIAVGGAHIGAGTLLFAGASDKLNGTPSKESLGALWDYGHPLVPAYALDAVGLQLDRLMMAQYRSLQEVGQYGAVADFTRQVMIVVSEAIAGAYFAIARNESVAGRIEEARAILGQAFIAYTALTAFTTAFVMRFDRLIFDTLFGSDVGAMVEPAVGLIAANYSAVIFRAYFFGQAIYLTQSSRLLLYSNAAHQLVATIAGLALVPTYGMSGAAAAMLIGHLAGCSVYCWAWRDHYVMRLPYANAALVAAAALLGYVLTGVIEQTLPTGVLAIGAQLLIFAGLALIVVRTFNIMSFNDLLAASLRRVRAANGDGGHS